MKYSITYIKEQIEIGKRIKYLFFWGHQQNKDGTITASCFSQWWEANFIVDEINYKTAEHWMMAKKAELFDDYDILNRIIDSKKPGEAKILGRQVNNFDAEKWDAAKYEIVKEGNYHKFTQNEDLKIFLSNTIGRILVEASPVDSIWGIGMAKDHPNIYNPEKWRGENLLGFALMEVRDVLNFN